MPVAKIDAAINDFSAGELDPDVKRSESPLIRMGGRQMLNWRTLNSKKKANRPGGTALFMATGRVEEFGMAGNTFFVNIFAGGLKIFNAAGAQVFSATQFLNAPLGTLFNIPWTAATLGGVTISVVGKVLWILYPDGAPSNVPQYLTWDGVSQTSTWAIAPFAETVEFSGQKRTAFYRISPANVTLQPSAVSGNINLTFSSNVLVAGMVGTRLRYCGQQLTITGVSNGTTGTATVNQPLPPGQTLAYTAGSIVGSINIGDEILGSSTGAAAIVCAVGGTQTLLFQNAFGYVSPVTNLGQTVTGGTSGTHGIAINSSYYYDGSTFRIWLTVAITSGTGFTGGENVTGPGGTFPVNGGVTNNNSNALTVQLIPNGNNTVQQFSTSDTAAGPSGNVKVTGTTNNIAPQAVSDWDDEVWNLFRGYPSDVFFDQARLGFANIPSVPSAVAWSALGLYYDWYPDAQPDDAIFELAPDQSTVFFVVPGMESSEFVFTDRAIYWIPISATVPLRPGSVAFQKLSDYGAMPNVQPRRADQSIVFMKAGGAAVGAVQTPGAYYRPNIVDTLSEMHSHLFTASPAIAIAIPSGPTQFEETYIYIALANGTAVVGRYAMRNGLIEPGPEGKPTIGWVPWNGNGTITWLQARQGDVIVTGTTPNGAASLVGKVDNTQYLDIAMSVNNPPTALQAAQPAHSSFVGNMTANGGLSSAFDGNRTQSSGASAVIIAADGYVGEQFTTPQTIGQALIWPTPDQGFSVTGTGNVTLELRAKQTAPANSTDGTLLGTATVSASLTTGPVVITPAYSTTTWAYAWIHIARSGATGLGIAQVLFQKGPLWWLAGGTAFLIDNGTRFMGTYTIDANGNLVPQFIGSENLASPNLIAGQPWTAVFEPFMPHAQPGQDNQQRLRKRKVAKGLVHVENSTGFVFGTRRVPAYFVGDDATQPAPLREGSFKIRPRGRRYDPRIVLTKDTPGPLTVVEYGFEVTV